MHGRSGIPTKGFNSVTACNNTHVVTHQLSRCTYRNISRHSIDVQCKFSLHLNRQEQELYTSLRNLAPSWMVRYVYIYVYEHIYTYTNPHPKYGGRIQNCLHVPDINRLFASDCAHAATCNPR